MKKIKDEKNNLEFGVSAIFKLYTLKDLIADAIYPTILSLLLLTSWIISKAELVTLTITLVELSICIIPPILGLMLVVYTIFVVLY